MPRRLSHVQAIRRARRYGAAAVFACAPIALGAQSAGGDATVSRTRPFAALSSTALSMRDSVVAVARAQIGTPYKLGGTTPGRGFDCSGLVRYVLGALKVALPRTAAQQAALGAALPKDTTQLQPGDLLTFGSAKRVTHIGIYVGNGRYVHASTTAGRVIETSLTRTRSPLVRSWRGGRRVLADGGPSADTSVVAAP
jgi:cell wall-associated NlpC family hydrolase